MDQKLLYTFRGWIGFVAFMDLGAAVRCFIEKRSFLGEHSLKRNDGLNYDDTILPRILGVYLVLKAIALIHCTLFIHYKPVVSMGICSLCVTIFMYCSESLYFQSTMPTFFLVFPCVLNVLTLLGLMVVPKMLELESPPIPEDEHAELMRHASGFRRRRTNKQK